MEINKSMLKQKSKDIVTSQERDTLRGNNQS